MEEKCLREYFDSDSKRNIYMACIWPVVDESKLNQAEEILKSVGQVIEGKNVFLTYRGMKNFLTQVYRNETWMGNIKNHFRGVQKKAALCYKEGQPVRIYLFESACLEEVRQIKESIRKVFQIGKHSIHISDNQEEAEDMAELLYHTNSIEFLNSAEPYRYSGIYEALQEMKKCIQRNGLDKRRFIVSSDAVFEICGLRRAKKLVFLTDYNKNEVSELKDICSAVKTAEDFEYCIPDLLYDSKNYFYFEGIKFISLQRYGEIQQYCHEKIDEKDAGLCKKFLSRSTMAISRGSDKKLDKICRMCIKVSDQVKNVFFGKSREEL